MIETLQNWDAAALAAARGWIDPSAAWFPALRAAVHAFADLEPAAFCLALAAIWLWAAFRLRSDAPKAAALRAFWATMLAFAAYWALNLLLPARMRPEEAVSSIAPLITHLPDNSFPSGHAIFAAASAWAFGASFGRKAGWVLFAVGVLTCAARVLAGVHYPGDILAGFAAGALFASAFVPFVRSEKFGKILVDPLVRFARLIRL